EAPVQCAVEIRRAVKEHPRLQLRMGIHSGPVSGIVDVNERASLAGAGINMAQRVMDCGDAGHILLSKHVAEDLEEYERWRPLLHGDHSERLRTRRLLFCWHFADHNSRFVASPCDTALTLHFAGFSSRT